MKNDSYNSMLIYNNGDEFVLSGSDDELSIESNIDGLLIYSSVD